MKAHYRLFFLSWISIGLQTGSANDLQDRLLAATAGEEVVVTAGRHMGPLRVPAGVHLRGGDAQTCMIDSGGQVPAIRLEAGSVLEGLTITGAGAFDEERFQKHFAERGEHLADHEGAVGTGRTSAAILISNVSATVRHCIVRDNGHPGIALSGAANRSLIEHNRVFQNMGGGICIADQASPRIQGNECWRNLRAGIGCRAAAPLIISNVCHHNVRAGIGVREGASPQVIDNHCHENQRAGIGIRMPATAPIVVGNTCERNGMAGIGTRDEATPTLHNNLCVSNRLAGIGAMSNARLFAVGNTLRGNQAAAIGLSGCTNGHALLRGNIIEGHTLVAIGIQAGWQVLAVSNTISRSSGMPPLVMVFEQAEAVFRDNTFSGTGIAAIRNAGHVEMAGNRFVRPAAKGPKRQALWALPGSTSRVGENQTNGWILPAVDE